MKILFTTDTLSRGGKERQLGILFSSLDASTYDAHVATLKLDERNNYFSEYPSLQQKLFVLGKQGLVSDLRAYDRLLSELEPDLVFSWDFYTSLLNLVLYRRHRFAFINGSIQHGIRLLRLSHFVRSMVVKLSPFVVANSRAGLRANGIALDERTFVLYNGIEARFSKQLSRSEVIARRHDLIPGYDHKENARVFVSVANLVPYKDYETVLSALATVEYPFYYLIAGEGPNREAIRAQIEELALGDRVVMLGRVQNVEEYLTIADVFIHSSRGEGCSNAILEAMFAGLPVIATDVGGTPEIVYDRGAALFPYRDVARLSDILINVDRVFNHFDSGSPEYQEHLQRFSVEEMTRTFSRIAKAVTTKMGG